MNRDRMGVLGLFVGLALLVSACGGAAEVAETTAAAVETTTTAAVEETTTTAAETVGELLIWADEARAPVVQEVSPAFTEATGIEVTVEILEFGQIRDQVGVAGPAGEGPDIFIGAHDWVGQLVVDGAISPIDLGGKEDQFVEVATTAFSFEGQLYAVPYATEAIALYYNTDLVPEAPATWDEMVSICESLEGIENCLGVPGGADAKDAYHNYPFVSVFGGFIFAYDPTTGYDPTTVGLDTPSAIDGVSFLAEQVEAGIVQSLNYDGAKTLFLEGSQPFWMTGPWEVGNLQGQDDVNWAVAKIPTVEGNAPAPFVGAQGFFLSAFSENRVAAQSFLLEFIATEEGMTALYEADPRVPAFIPVFDTVSSDPVVAAFGLSAADGVPMPNIPQMGSVWDPLGDALLLVRNQEADPAEAMETAAEAVRTAVGEA